LIHACAGISGGLELALSEPQAGTPRSDGMSDRKPNLPYTGINPYASRVGWVTAAKHEKEAQKAACGAVALAAQRYRYAEENAHLARAMGWEVRGRSIYSA
jgi:hypothetical protein